MTWDALYCNINLDFIQKLHLFRDTVLPLMFWFLRCFLEIWYFTLQMGKSPVESEKQPAERRKVKNVTGEALLFLKVSQMGRVLLGAWRAPDGPPRPTPVEPSPLPAFWFN